MKKILFIEGLPGSGKSTFTRRLKEHYISKGMKVISFNEGDLHPIDYAWCSILSADSYNDLLSKYEKYKDKIINYTKQVDQKYITAYTKIEVLPEDIDFYKDFSEYEIYREDNLELFKSAHIDLWNRFNLDALDDSIYIFECVFLQNHINELILKYNLNLEEIISYFQDLIKALGNIDINLFYLKQVDIDYTLNQTIEARRSTKPEYKDWIDNVIEYFESTRYAKELGYTSIDGALRYFKDRQAIELKILNNLDIKTNVFDVYDDYDKVFKEILKVKI
jgi:hypothetical protein